MGCVMFKENNFQNGTYAFSFSMRKNDAKLALPLHLLVISIPVRYQGLCMCRCVNQNN